MANSHDRYKFKFNAYYMSCDEKPNGKSRRKIAKQARAWNKKLVMDELAQLDSKEDLWEQLNEEASEALYCHYYGPCQKCLEREAKDENKD